jgi:8-oxo-dGTP pyrophosphatase MutT (NUDIX family)
MAVPADREKVSQLPTKRAKSMGTWITRPLKKQKLEKRAQRGKPIVQVAALPYRHTEEGVLEILLLTSRQTGRFILPKGWPMKDRRDCEAAAEEAAEEAGVVGTFHEQSVGSFRYWKRLKGYFVPVTVEVYPLRVEQELDKWKERKSRRRAWLKLEQATLLVDEPELVSILDDVVPKLARI